MHSQSSLVAELKDKEYRDAFVASQIRIGLPMQCRALRESRGWTQPELAKQADMSQPRISEIERPGERNLSLDTLLRLASAFDVALQVNFVPFTQLIEDDETRDFDDLFVPGFTEDISKLERLEMQIRSTQGIDSKIEQQALGGTEVPRTPQIDVSEPTDRLTRITKDAANAA